MRPVALSALALALAGPAMGADTPPSWLKQPRAEDLGRVWPRDAYRRGLGGSAVMRCRVTVEGLLADCNIMKEDPPGLGFGPAALALAPTFLFTPAKRNGAPIPAGVTIPVRFDLGYGGNVVPAPAAEEIRIAPYAPWSQAPSREEVRAAYPKAAGAIVGHVAMRCPLRASGLLGRCEILTEEPTGKGFAGAARSLAPKFRASLQGGALDAVRKGDIVVNLAVHFRGPEEAGPPYLAQVDWLRTIDPAKAVKLFPEKAVAANLRQGRATVDCVVQPTGDLGQCDVVEESVPGMGFGEAASLVAANMRANLWTRDGQPTPGARIKLPIRLDYKASDPEAAKP